MTLTYHPAATLSADQLAHAFNAGYSGYYVPIAFDAAIMQDHIFKHDKYNHKNHDGSAPIIDKTCWGILL